MKRIALIAVSLLALVAASATAEEWKKEFMLYGWLAGIEGTIGVGNVGEEPVSASFDDLAGFVDFAMAGHYETKNARNIFLTDVSYVGLSNERDAEVANQPVTVDMDFNQWIVEVGGGYRVKPEFDVLVVGRWYILDLGSSIAEESIGDTTYNWGDIYVGGRYSKILKEKWILALRADIGTGGSELAWFGDALVGYRFNDKFSTSVAYRVLSLDRQPEGDNYFLYDITQAGLGIGLGFGF